MDEHEAKLTAGLGDRDIGPWLKRRKAAGPICVHCGRHRSEHLGVRLLCPGLAELGRRYFTP